MKHTVVCYEPNRFNGWPANGGAWSWGDEILVSFQSGVFDPNSKGHRIRQDLPMAAAFARSIDGGESWVQEPSQYDIYKQPVLPVPGEGFDFGPDFVMRIGAPTVTIISELYIVSQDRGHTWQGPYAFPSFSYPLTSRTAYHIDGRKHLRAYLSYKLPNDYGLPYTDRAFVAETRDGGCSWQKVGEMTDDIARSVMPSVARLPDGVLVAAMRRRVEYDKLPPDALESYITLYGRQMWNNDNWIETRRSTDDGKTWETPVRAGETGHERPGNGNPPALVCLPDGRLVLAYGYRGDHAPGFSIRATVSADGGRSFGEPIVLRHDALSNDIGYPRIVVRSDGACVVMYYYTADGREEQHIAATIFQP